MNLITNLPANFTSLRVPLTTGNLGILKNPVIKTHEKLPILRELITKAKSLVGTDAINERIAKSLTITDKATQDKEFKDIAAALQKVNRPKSGTMAYATSSDYFALTPTTPKIEGKDWKDVQIILDSPQKLLEMTERGKKVIQSNEINPELSAVAIGLPVAGEASRAEKYAKDHPEQVRKIRALGGLDKLKKDQLPPRFLYPVSTPFGPKTLYGLMLSNFLRTSSELGRLSLAINMFNSKSSELVIDRLEKEGFDSSFSNDQLDLLLGFVQAVAPRIFLSDDKETEELFATGHGEFPRALAEAGMFQMMHDMGIKYLVFGNSDEFLWGADPTMIGIADKLVEENGYEGMVMVVKNPTNLPGGGVVRNLLTPTTSFKLVESMCLPPDLSDGKNNPSTLNTTFYILSTKALASKAYKFLENSLGLDVKTTDKRGNTEQVGCLETWAGTEFTKNLNCAFVVGQGVGMFTGIKTLEHTHSDNIPKILQEFPNPNFSKWTYEKLIKYLATTQPFLIKSLIDGDEIVAKEIWKNGYSYLVNPIVAKHIFKTQGNTQLIDWLRVL